MSAKKGGSRTRHASARGFSGGRGVSGQRSGVHQQRVIVKARVVRNGPRVSGRRGLAEHVSYLGRDEVGPNGEKGQLFNDKGNLASEEVEQFIDEASTDRHHFRLIVSPERGADLDLEEYARELMTQTEADLGTRLQWVGVVHSNTDNPHVHITIRGVDERGADLVMNRDYISHGLRYNAQEIATRYLGPRLEADLERERQANISAERFTPLDRKLIERAAAAPDGLVSTRQPTGAEPEWAYKKRLADIGRLQNLEGFGLAEEVSPGQWKLDPDLANRLRLMGSRQDIIHQLHQRLGPRERPRDVVLYNKEAPPGVKIVGEVIDRGPVDELSDRRYIAVNAADGRVYHVALSRFSERPGEEARVGSIVALKTVERPIVTVADENIQRIAAANAGVYDAGMHLAEVQRHGGLPAGADPAAFVAAHVRRAEGHARRKLVEAIDSERFRVPSDLSDQLKAAASPARDSGAHIQVEHQSAIGLREQMRAVGPTWLDQRLAAEQHLQRFERVGASRFEHRVRAAMRGRLAVLDRRGLVERRDGQMRLRTGTLDTLYRQEHEHKVAQLAQRYGQHVPLPPGSSFSGRVVEVEAMASGRHVVVAGDGRFALVPAQPALVGQLGRQVELSIGRGPARDAASVARPMQMQVPLRHVALDGPARWRATLSR